MNYSSTVLLTLAVLGLTSGCVTGTRSFDMPVHAADSYTKDAGKGTIAVGTVTDSRQFMNKPDDPSTPSAKGDVNELTIAAKNTYIGRQRNTYGHAMGDIALPAGETVQTKLAALLTEGLKRRGFDVVEAGKTPNLVTADIQQFWSWSTPGFVVLTFEAHLKASVVISRGGKTSTLVVTGYGKNHGQIAKDGNWQEAWDIAFTDFLANLNDQLAKDGE